MKRQRTSEESSVGRSLASIKTSFHRDYPLTSGELLLVIDNAAKMFTNFSEYEVGSWVPGWKPVWGASALTFEVAKTSKWRGLELKQERKARSFLAWTGAGKHEDVELLGRFRCLDMPRSDMRITHHLFRARAHAIERTGLGVSLSLRGSAGALHLHEMRQGDLRRLSRVEVVFEADRWHWLRFRSEGERVYARLWGDLDSEPKQWTIQGRASSKGEPGLTGFGMSVPSHVQWSQVGLAVHGLTAPDEEISY